MSFDDLASDETLTTVAGRKQREDELEQRIEAWTAQREDQASQDQLIAAGVAAYVVQNGAQCIADPQNIQRGHFIRVPQNSAGDMLLENSRYRLSRTPAEISRAGPDQGEHNFEVLSGVLGYDDDKIAGVYASLCME